MADQRYVEAENVNVPGSKRRLNADKYEAVRAALLQVLPASGDGLSQAEMHAAVRASVDSTHFPLLWWIKAVQLDLEAKRLVRRIPAKGGTRWLKA
jgi:hypothetical protein